MDIYQTHNPQNYKLDKSDFPSYDELYNSIPKEGSLGLLALGALGLKLWRKKRADIEKAEQPAGKDSNAK
jgi:hypothetical protein